LETKNRREIYKSLKGKRGGNGQEGELDVVDVEKTAITLPKSKKGMQRKRKKKLKVTDVIRTKKGDR